jgi:uncharacterized protein
MKAHVLLILLALFYLSSIPAYGTDIQKLRSQAEAGDAKAQFELGRAYQEGAGVQQNDQLAVDWYRKSAEHDYPQAENSLGVMYARGFGIARDKAEAFHWYKKAAKRGLPEACFNVAISYYNGDGTGEDIPLAYAWMLVAKNNGDTQAEDALKRIGDELHGEVELSKYKLAAIYERGDDVAQDWSRAVSLYVEVANAEGKPLAGDAQYKLCQLYAEGKGVQQDWSQAKSWCKKAAGHGKAFAYVVLGRMAEQGLGEEKNIAEAADWYQDAALARVPDGFISSGKLRLVSASHDDQKKAYFWFYLAQRFRIAEADPLLQQAATKLSDKEIAREQKRAMEWIAMPMPERMRNFKKH